MLRKAEKGEIPALRGLYVWRHFPRQQQVFQRYGQTPGLPGWVIRYPQTKPGRFCLPLGGKNVITLAAVCLFDF